MWASPWVKAEQKSRVLVLKSQSIQGDEEVGSASCQLLGWSMPAPTPNDHPVARGVEVGTLACS